MEASSGRKLGWFFEQWLDRPGCPQLSIRWEGESVFVEQLQEDLFRFRLPLQWTNGEGKRQKQVFEVRQRTHKFSLGSKVSAPAVDPDVELLYR
jgi:aminopeptidase N